MKFSWTCINPNEAVTCCCSGPNSSVQFCKMLCGRFNLYAFGPPLNRGKPVIYIYNSPLNHNFYRPPRNKIWSPTHICQGSKPCLLCLRSTQMHAEIENKERTRNNAWFPKLFSVTQSIVDQTNHLCPRLPAGALCHIQASGYFPSTTSTPVHLYFSSHDQHNYRLLDVWIKMILQQIEFQRIILLNT